MRIQKIVCDRCKKEIPGNPIKIFVNDVERNTGDIIAENKIAKSIELKECDFCECCIKDMFCEKTQAEEDEYPDIISGPDTEFDPEEEPVSDPDTDTGMVEYDFSEDDLKTLNMVTPPPTMKGSSKFDYGKLMALTNAGWSAKQIAGEMGISEATVYNKRSEVKSGKVKISS